MTRFDGGSELETLREEISQGMQPTSAQQDFLDTESDDAWKRPCLALRDIHGAEIRDEKSHGSARASVYGKCLNEFAVSQCPSYRRLSVLRQDLPPKASEQTASDEVLSQGKST